MKFDPSIKIGEVFDLKNGLFSVVQNNLLTVYLSLKGMKGTVSSILLNRVISGVYFEVSKEEAKDGTIVSSRTGTIWSEPSTVDDIVCDIYPFFDNEKTYRSTRNNIQKVLNEIIDQRFFYRFGRNNFYAYTYEKNLVSWKYLFDTESFVYPHTLKKMLSSEADLWALFLNSSKDGDGKLVFTLDEFFHHFALFIDGMIGELPKTVGEKFVRFDKSEKYARLFLDECRSVASTLGDYEGFVDDGSCKMDRLPASISEKFSDIIPADERPGYIPPRAVSSRGAVYRRKKNLEKFSESYELEDRALRICEEPTHLMTYFDRRVKETLGISHNLVIFKNVSLETEACLKIFDVLVENKNGESFLKDWIRWYIRNHRDNILDARNSLLHGLLKSYDVFVRSTTASSGTPHSSIFDEIKKEFKESIDIERLCRKHGVFDVYNFIFVAEGESEATKHFDHFYEYVNNLSSIQKKDLVIEVMRSTFNEKFIDLGYLFDKDHKVVKKLQELAVQFAANIKILPASIMDREHYDFKERIKYEHLRRTSANK